MADSVAVAPAQNDALLHDQKPGGWEPIKNINDPYVQEMGRFSVMEHMHKIVGISMDFIRVVSGQTQGVAGGTKYRLVVEVKQTIIVQDMPTSIDYYKATVLDKPPEKLWKLLSFVHGNKN